MSQRPREAPPAARLGAIGLALAMLTAVAAAADDPRTADLVKAGVVRVALDVANPLLAARSPVTADYRGLTVGLANALGARIGVPVRLLPYTAPPEILDALRDKALDVGFLAIDPARAAVVDFSPALVEVDNAYLISPGASIREVGELDGAGVRIAVVKGYGADLFLTRALRRASLVRSPDLAAAVDLVITGQADVAAGHLPSLRALAPKLPGARLLVDRFIGEAYGIAVPKGQRARLAYLTEFVEEAKASGFVRRGIEELGLEGVRPAPPSRSANPRRRLSTRGGARPRRCGCGRPSPRPARRRETR
ncbi:MAG TPA: transporter substrate-binding domain-containing protein [Methylomirabilota bacterium]|nr:transporter substrate-binding domain-containing protein [Methylomirabilota bacterium]